jgi:hypothetical protein
MAKNTKNNYYIITKPRPHFQPGDIVMGTAKTDNLGRIWVTDYESIHCDTCGYSHLKLDYIAANNLVLIDRF